MSEPLLTDEDVPEDISVDGSESLYTPSEEEFEDSEEEYCPKNKIRRKNTSKESDNENQNGEENSENVDTPSEEDSEDSEKEYQHINKSRRKYTHKINNNENEENSENVDTPSEGEPEDDEELVQNKRKSKEGKIDGRRNNGGVKAGDKSKAVQKMDKIEARSVIRYLYIKGKNSREIHKNMKDIYGDTAPSYDTVVRWRRYFNGGNKILYDKPRSGRPSLADVEDIVKQVKKYLQEDNKMTIHAIMKKTKLGYGTVWKIIHEELHMCKKNECWVPRADAIQDEREV